LVAFLISPFFTLQTLVTEENALFYLAVQSYRQLAEGSEQQQNTAAEIFDKYVRSGAELEIGCRPQDRVGDTEVVWCSLLVWYALNFFRSRVGGARPNDAGRHSQRHYGQTMHAGPV